MKRFAPMILIMLCILMRFGVGKTEEYLDYRFDPATFTKAIAELNISLTENEACDSKESGLLYTPKAAVPTMVLFVTKKIPLDFADAGFEPMKIVYGPNGFSVLITADVSKAIQWLLEQEEVLYAEPDSTVSGCSEENEEDLITFHSWGAEMAGYREYVQFASQYGQGHCTVAVIDSGTCRHPRITPQLRLGGHDYIDNDDDSSNDLNGHGTRVSGIVADCTQGLPVYIYPIRVLDANAYGKTSNVICAIMEATEANVDIINLSLSTFTHSELMESTIRDAISSGIIVVAAAGNYNCDASEVEPACMTDAGIIVVGSAEIDGSRSSFSNYGPSVDVYFYGSGVLSCSRSGGYVSDSGTSMAAPHISALCAMMRLTHASMSAGAMVSRMLDSAKESCRIPLAEAMVPKGFGFHIAHAYLKLDEVFLLPVKASPKTSQEIISYKTSDENIVSISDGTLVAVGEGTVEIIASCKGLEDETFCVTVQEGEKSCIYLPGNLKVIDDEAFYGITSDLAVIQADTKSIGNGAFDGGKISFISIPDSVITIGNNDFSNAVLICTDGSFAQKYAIDHQLQYLTSTD